MNHLHLSTFATERDLRLVWIRDTMRLERLLVSQGCLDSLRAPWELEVDPGELRLAFDSGGFFVPFFD